MASPATATSIPRFLLPQSGMLWRRIRAPGSVDRLTVRYASSGSSSKASSKPLVLEKPAKFNPPSHGARLPKRGGPRHYGGELSATEAQAQKTRDYPGLMAPEGTTAHWFWHSRALHLVITMSCLTGLATFTFVENFKRTSPFADMLPSGSDFASHPFRSIRTTVEVVRLSEAQRSAEVAEKRKRRVDDVVKRSEYRKAHGLDKQQGFGGWTAKTDAESMGPAVVVHDGSSAEGLEDGKRKKFLGIF